MVLPGTRTNFFRHGRDKTGGVGEVGVIELSSDEDDEQYVTGEKGGAQCH